MSNSTTSDTSAQGTANSDIRATIVQYMDLNNNPETGGFEQSFIDTLADNVTRGVEQLLQAAKNELVREILHHSFMVEAKVPVKQMGGPTEYISAKEHIVPVQAIKAVLATVQDTKEEV